MSFISVFNTGQIDRCAKLDIYIYNAGYSSIKKKCWGIIYIYIHTISIFCVSIKYIKKYFSIKLIKEYFNSNNI